jgi:hypothetical protein
MKRSVILPILLTLGFLLMGLMSVHGAEAGLAPDRSYQTAPPLRLDSLYFRIQEAAIGLFRQGCQEVKVVVLPDRDGALDVYATCAEWQEVRPASQ